LAKKLSFQPRLVAVVAATVAAGDVAVAVAAADVAAAGDCDRGCLSWFFKSVAGWLLFSSLLTIVTCGRAQLSSSPCDVAALCTLNSIEPKPKHFKTEYGKCGVASDKYRTKKKPQTVAKKKLLINYQPPKKKLRK